MICNLSHSEIWNYIQNKKLSCLQNAQNKTCEVIENGVILYFTVKVIDVREGKLASSENQ